MTAADHVSVDPDRVRVEEAREAGAVHVGHQMWRRLTLDAILAEAGLSARARVLAEVMTLSRLVRPASEHAMPDWIRRTALPDILGEDFSTLSDEALYRNLDRLHPQRETIERALAAREHSLFNLADTLYFYDLNVEKYAACLHYGVYLAAGYPISSGVVEGACRYLVRGRMELTGARWRLTGAETVPKLRALRASGDFDDTGWTFHEARERERDHASHYAGGVIPPVTPPTPAVVRPRLRRVK